MMDRIDRAVSSAFRYVALFAIGYYGFSVALVQLRLLDAVVVAVFTLSAMWGARALLSRSLRHQHIYRWDDIRQSKGGYAAGRPACRVCGQESKGRAA